jgi:Glycosyl transferase family 11
MIVISGEYGRLGNRLWTYANLLAFGAENGVQIRNPRFRSAPFFQGTGPCTKIAGQSWPALYWGLCHRLNLRARMFSNVTIPEGRLVNIEQDADFLTLARKRALVFVDGFFFTAPQSMRRRTDDLRQFFALKAPLEKARLALATQARGDTDVLIGVHIRHGDYRTYCDSIMFYETHQYAKVMHSIAAQFPGRKVAFLVCSDERQDPAVFAGLNVTISDNPAVVDMYALASCNFIVGPSSSFSQWASFYGNVPLHILNYKAHEIFRDQTPVYEPNIKADFRIFTSDRFGEFGGRPTQMTAIGHSVLGR